MLAYLRTLPGAAHPRILEALDRRDESDEHVQQLMTQFSDVFLDPDSRHPTEDRTRFWNLDGRLIARWTIQELLSESS